MGKATVSPEGDITLTTPTVVTPNPPLTQPPPVVPGPPAAWSPNPPGPPIVHPVPPQGAGLQTGDNGFEIDGVKQTFDVGVPDGQAQTNGIPGYGTYQPGVDVSKGYVNDDGTPKDLSTPTRTTLAQYLSNVTQGKEGSARVPNRYPVNPKTVSYGDLQTMPVLSMVSTSDDKGNPAALDAQGSTNNSSFAPAGVPDFDYKSQAYPTLASLIKKGKSSNGGIDGNDLLIGVAGTASTQAAPGSLTSDASTSPTMPNLTTGHPDTTKVVIDYTSAVLKTNRFTSAAAAFASVPDTSDPGGGYDPTFTQQGKLGVYDPGAPTVTAGRLATVGPLLTLRATTTLGATNPGADPNSGGEEAAALLPGLSQLGTQRIDQHVLQARDILANLTTSESTSTLSIGSDSWGSLNNTNDPYSGTDALGMMTLSLALVVGLTLITDALSLLLGLITPQLKQPTHDASGRYALGQYYANSKTGTNGPGGGGALGAISALASLNFGALLGINPTNYPFSLAMQTGFNAFFGLPQGGGLVGQLLGALTSSTDSPQFNIVVARTIIRSFLIIKDSLSKIGGNPMNVINAILSMIDTIRTSKIIAALNVWASLGDAILSVPDTFTDASSAGGTRISSMDSIDDGYANAVNKSRLQNSLKLAWANNRQPSQLLLPSAIQGISAITRLGQFNTYHAIGVDISSKTQVKAVTPDMNGRISSDDAIVLEKSLDAEYMPFSFQDVRTNEFIGFHAFLAQLTDDYNAQYDKHDAFGRVEPIRIYKGTERRISLAFYIAATSPNDFDEMWVKINKLVTLVYPQYTAGQLLTDGQGQYTFVQPFSQLMGSSPLIRLRLGDLLKSNFSQFNLARLFGVDNTSFTVGGQKFTDQAKFSQDQKDKITKAMADALAHPNGETYYANGNYGYNLSQDQGGQGGISVPLPNPLGGPQKPKFKPQFAPHDYVNKIFTIKATDTDDSGNIIGEVQINTEPDDVDDIQQYVTDTQKKYGDDDVPTLKVIGGKYIFTPQSLTATSTTRNNIFNKLYQASADPFAQALSDFLNPSTATPNAIAKAFADTGGKGLAGFIDTMNFDWYDKVTWETDSGRAAPKLCKVTMTFSPVHDISPGIDHLGFNRAPVYPVGLMNQTAIPPKQT